LVLLDVMLPDIDGLQVCGRIKADAALANTFVVLLSDERVDSDNQAEGLEEDADDYVVRPVSNRELLARVEAMLRLRRAEKTRRAQMHELRERVKELNCLYGISKLIETADLSLPEILQGTAELIPPAWQYPDIACARIVIDDQVCQTEGFRETAWRQSRAIRVHGEPPGRVEVYYLEERPEADEGPFLKEERSLLNAIAERLGRIVERIRAERALSESEERYRVVSELTSDLAYAFRVEIDGTLVQEWMTQALSQVTGFSSEALAARGGLTSVIHPDDQPAAQRHVQKLLAGQHDAYEFRIMTKEGQVRWLHDSGHPVQDEMQGRTVRIYGAARDITERKLAEAQLEKAAATAERERLARELHDAVTQSLFSVAAIAEAVPRVWERDPQEARRGLEELRLLTQGALAEMRAMLLELRPSALTEQRLGVLLRQLTDAMMCRTRLPVTTTLVGDCLLRADVQIALYRIAQEALNNITKHARATQARLSLHCEPALVRLRIDDDGIGFDPDIAQTHQLGLQIMRERAQAIGAELEVESRPGHGTRIEVE
jgi:PAS domain S-box-containing protein